MAQQREIDIELIELFTERLTAVGGHVHRASSSSAVAVTVAGIAAELGEHTAWVSSGVVNRAPELTAALRSEGLTPQRADSPKEVRDQPLGIVIAEGAIAETGSAIMSERTLGDRAVSLMTRVLVVLCATTTLMPSLDDAGSVLREISAESGSYATFITGPSRSADIERQLTVGVQGPGVYHFVLVDRLA